MPQVINTNVPSLNAQRNLNTSGTSLATTLQRLSSGLRINSAKDDAAGLAISDRFTTQIRGLNQAARNANDGISLSQTGEGALAEITTNLQRIRELSVQSANATNSASDRAALDLEVQQRLAEVDRIATQTSFNGRKILDGSFGNATFQVGANVGQTISLDLNASSRTDAIGAIAEATTSDLTSVFGNISEVGGTFTTATSQAAGASAAGESFSFQVDGVSIYTETQTNTSGVSGAFAALDAGEFGASGEVYALAVDGVEVFRFESTAAFATETVSAAQIDAGIAAAATDLANAGISVTGTAAAGTLAFTRADGAQFSVSVANTASNITAAGFANFNTGSTASVTGPQLNVTAAELDSALVAKAPALTAAGISFTGTAAGGDLSFARNDGSKFEVVLANNFTTAGGFANNFIAAAGALSNGTSTVDEATPLTLQAGDLSIRLGGADNAPVNITGTFTNLGQLADAISSQAPGVTALVGDNNQLQLFADQQITLAGTEAQSGGQLAFTALSNGTTGTLNDVSVVSVAAANDAIQRVDAALTSISTLRSTFGAIQNRFESTINNLQTTSENLSASRSRILDTDFAAETAELTRTQILQQAGTAILAQANQLPQNVLSLLR